MPVSLLTGAERDRLFGLLVERALEHDDLTLLVIHPR